MRNRFWQAPPWGLEARQGIRRLAARAGMPEAMAAVLWNRGYTSPEAVAELLGAARQVSDPRGLPDMEPAVAALRAAIARGAPIRVYGDYDADGVSAAALLTRALAVAGARVDCRLPNRFDEGYGLQVEAVEAAAGDGIELLVTVDCGSTSLGAARRAQELGMGLVVTDHHALAGDLPAAAAVVNPERQAVPNRLAGAGVALWLARALLGDGQVPEALWALAAVGTVADVVPLTGDNRALVLRGLGALRRGAVPGLETLLAEAGRAADDVGEEEVAFFLAPHLNAAGRMGAPGPALALLLAESRREAEPWARELLRLNALRRQAERQVLEEAWLAVPRDGRGRVPDFVVVSGADWHEGVIGIVAGRLREALARPVAVVTVPGDGGPAKGSARGVPGLDLVARLRAHGDLFLSLGGHRGAAGFSLAPGRVGELAGRLAAPLEDGVRRLQYLGPEVDAVVPASALDGEMTRWLARLAPFGHGFEPARFVVAGEVEEVRALGQEGRHLRFRWRPHGLPAVAFGAGGVLAGGDRPRDEALTGPGSIGVRRFKGRERAEWQARDLPFAYPGAPFAGRLQLGPAPAAPGIKVVRVVDSDRAVRRRAADLGAEPYHWGRPRGELRLAEMWARGGRLRCLVVSQWRPWPRRLEGWADLVIWEARPRSRRALAESAAWLNPGGQIWYDPADEMRQRERILKKIARLDPSRERMARLWRALAAGGRPLLPGRAVLEELGLRPGEVEAGERRPLTDSVLFRLARAALEEARADQALSLRAWADGPASRPAGGAAPGGGGQDEPVGNGSRVGL